MRDYRLQTFINFTRLGLSAEMAWSEILSYLWWWLKSGEIKKVSANKFFDKNDFVSLKKFAFAMARFDQLWFPRLIEPTTLGIRTWEYGVLLSNLKFKDKKVLDLGVGSSRLPYYLSYLGAKVTAVDLSTPMEEEIILADNRVKWVGSDMTNLPFKNNSYDIILNISAMEHLDADYPSNKPVNRKVFIDRTRKTIQEMARVCKKDGFVYVTTDFYLSEQKTDGWKTEVKYEKIGGAYQMTDMTLIISEFLKSGCQMISRPELDFDLLKGSNQHSNYRGRYFTTAALLFRKR